MSLSTFVSTLPGSTRQFLGNIFHKKNGHRAQQQQFQALSPHSTSTSISSTNNNNPNDSITANNNSIRNEKVAATPLPISSTFLEKYPSALETSNTSILSVLLPPVSIRAGDFDYNYHTNRISNTSSRESGTGTPLCESPPQMLILPPRRSSIGTNTSNSSASSVTTPPTSGIAGAGASAALTSANTGLKSPSPLSPRGDSGYTQGHVAITFTKFISTPTIPTPALTVSTAPPITTTSNNIHSGLDSFLLNNKDDSAEDIILNLEAMSPTTRKKKFDHFTFLRSSVAATATSERRNGGGGGGGGAVSILSNLASTFKRQHDNNNTSSNSSRRSPSKLSLGFTHQHQQPQHQHQQQKGKQQEQQQSQLQPLQQPPTLKSPRSQLFFITGRSKKESVRPLTFNKLSSKRVSSSSPSVILDVPSLPATETKSSATTATPATTTKTTTSRISNITSPTRTTATMKTKRLSKNQPATAITAATITSTPASAPAPVNLTESELFPSPLSMMHWPILPELVVIRDLPEYVPGDSFGCNAKRNEKYARTRLVALREHQQVLVGLLGDLLTLDQQRREQQPVFKDPAHSVEKATVTAATRKNTPASVSVSQAAVLTTSSSKDQKEAGAAAEADCECNCQKRRRHQIQKHDSAVREYQRAILDLWQTDENLCHWLSRYIRTTRHIDRRLDYMLAAMAEDNRNGNSTTTVLASSPSPFKYPAALGMTQEIGYRGYGIVTGTSATDRPGSGVSNPELERMGILQPRLLGYPTTDLSLKESGTDGSECQSHPSTFRTAALNEITMESTTLGMIDTGLSPMRLSRQKIPTIKVNSPELLFKPLPKLPDNNDTSNSSRKGSVTSITPSFTTINSLPRGVVATMRRRGLMRESRLVPGPMLSQAIRELVTSSAPIAPPPAIPAPKRPKPPTFPINISSSIKRTSAVRIVSTSFFPSVPSLPASAMIAYSRTRPSYPLPPGFTASGAGDARLCDSMRSPISTLAPILELNQADQKNQLLSLLQPCESESSRNSMSSATDPTVTTCAKDVKDIKPRLSTSTLEATTPAPAPASTVTTATPKSATASDNATQMAMMVSDVGDYNEIDASVFVGYHLQSLSKANGLLLRFNKESRRSHAVLQRFEAAKRAFERRVLGYGLGLDCAGVGEGSDSEQTTILDKIFVYGVAVILPLVFIYLLIHLCGWWRFFRIRKSPKTATTAITTTTVIAEDDAPDYSHIIFDNNGNNDDADLPPYSTAIAMDNLQAPPSPPPAPTAVSDQAAPAPTPASVPQS
ncbi:hypothetical protein BG015_007589 [Linnemannia schmuckeri]|uniref:Uncharacterized protein n=1 Tax=Linnemannia schmuckeri TaxID=64567 RepID=A0A9P5VEN5_9FUNG|nr:hypothetical protein BG015_007589 [Linnemannia schmuckeri]